MAGQARAPASVEVTIVGEETTVSNPDTGCEERVTLIATGSREIASVQEVGVGVALVAEPVVLEEVCGSQGTPAAPKITPPPTDTIPTADAPGASGAGGVGPRGRRCGSSWRSSWPGHSRPARALAGLAGDERQSDRRRRCPGWDRPGRSTATCPVRAGRRRRACQRRRRQHRQDVVRAVAGRAVAVRQRSSRGSIRSRASIRSSSVPAPSSTTTSPAVAWGRTRQDAVACRDSSTNAAHAAVRSTSPAGRYPSGR